MTTAAPWRLIPDPRPWGRWPYTLPGTPAAQAWLQSHRVQPGDRVGLIAANCPAVASIAQAASAMGLTLIIFHQRLPTAILEQQLTAAHCRVVISDRTLSRPTLLLPELFALTTGTMSCDHHPGGELIMHTSGSTGVPKRVRLPWERVYASCAAACTHLTLHPGETWLAALPCDHIGGLALILRAAIAGYPLLMPRPHQPMSADVYTQVQAVSLVPTMLYRLLHPPTVRHGLRAIIGGAPLDAELARQAQAAGIHACTTYGLTETCAMVACQTLAQTGQPGQGTLLPGWEARIRDPDQQGLGALELRGPGRCAGYESDQPMTLTALPVNADSTNSTNSTNSAISADTWMPTNDVATLSQNRLTVWGRADDVIISGGEKISAARVASTLALHPQLQDVAVIGQPDPEWGHCVEAIAVSRGPAPSSEDLTAWCAERLAPHQIPKRWHWRTHLPRTELGKLHRPGLRSGPFDLSESV